MRFFKSARPKTARLPRTITMATSILVTTSGLPKQQLISACIWDGIDYEKNIIYYFIVRIGTHANRL